MAVKVKIQINSAQKIIRDKGLDPNGKVQLFHTENINRRIDRYMPRLTGTLISKKKRISSPTTIEVAARQAQYLYYGVKMVNAKTGKGPAHIPGVGYRYPEGAILRATNIPLKYTKSKKGEFPGPFWDRRLVAAEGDLLAAETTAYLRRQK